ncbi:GNAT family N-acetyltransferase [Emticicia sp. 17c]|uniref:GNAT family N-acetyltransferase n=1 Tax=Emticicia sp. 17c TaxID=3127704 RepID=UPI00301C33E7
MNLNITKVTLNDVLPLRALYLQEMNRQIRYNAYHERGWTDSYLIYADTQPIGYGAIKGQEVADRNTIFEFYLIPPYRYLASRVFAEWIQQTSVNFIECQSNDQLLSSMLYEFADRIHAPVILFEDDRPTTLSIAEGVFRAKADYEATFGRKVEDGSGYVLEKNGEIVASGDFLLHYNPPFADLYMEVKESERGKGLGAFIIQELRRVCYLAGRVPAARCNVQNKASKATLLKGGLKVAGCMLMGEIKPKQ